MALDFIKPDTTAQILDVFANSAAKTSTVTTNLKTANDLRINTSSNPTNDKISVFLDSVKMLGSAAQLFISGYPNLDIPGFNAVQGIASIGKAVNNVNVLIKDYSNGNGIRLGPASGFVTDIGDVTSVVLDGLQTKGIGLTPPVLGFNVFVKGLSAFSNFVNLKYGDTVLYKPEKNTSDPQDQIEKPRLPSDEVELETVHVIADEAPLMSFISENGEILSLFKGTDGLTKLSFSEANGTTVELAGKIDEKGNFYFRTRDEERGVEADYLVDSKGEIIGAGSRNIDETLGPAEIISLYEVERKYEQEMSFALSTTAEFLALAQAIQSGEPLATTRATLTIGNSIIRGTDWGKTVDGKNLVNGIQGVTAVLGAVGSVVSLKKAIENKDGIGVAYSGASLVGYSASAFAAMGNETAKAVAGTMWGTAAQGANAATVGVIPALGIVASLANGDVKGAAVSAMAMVASLQGFPVVGQVIGIAYMLYSLFNASKVPDAWGEGHFTWNNGQIGLNVVGETGGNARVGGMLGNLKATMEYLVQKARTDNPEMPIGAIPLRFGSLTYRDDKFTLHDLDPVTGVTRDRVYDFQGKRLGVSTDDPEFFIDLQEALLRNAIERQGLAAQYEVDTVYIKNQAGDPKAGLTEVQMAASDGKLAPTQTGDTQRFRPIGLDMDGDGRISTIARENSNVAFNVDDSGYLKQTGWIGAGDAMLVLDRNLSSYLDAGSDLFSNAKLADELKGVPSLAGVLTASTLNASTFAVTDDSILFDFIGVKNGNQVDLTIKKATDVVSAVQKSGKKQSLPAAQVLDQW
jgi:hypothetical protein